MVEGNPDQSDLLRDVEIEPNVKLKCVSRFAIWLTCLVQGKVVKEAARATVRCACAKFKELSSILIVCGASYNIKIKIYRAYVRSVLTYGTET